jgi:hypothetical protein
MSVDDIAAIIGAVRPRLPVYADALLELVVRSASSGDERFITIPEALGAPPSVRKVKLPERQQDAIASLAGLAGQEVLKVPVGRGEIRLAGAIASIPEDFAPAIILDASGRVRSTYRLWELGRGSLRRLPEAVNHYGNVRLNVWQRSCGRQVLADPGERTVIAEGIADAIRARPDERWLIVHYLEREDLVREVRALVGDETHISSLTWGMHHGTNAFADVRNIVIVGQHNYGQAAYPAHVAAASRCAVQEIDEEEVLAVARGEFQHHLLQAVCRSSVRRSQDGRAGPGRVYLITTPRPDLSDLVGATFPGSSMRKWVPQERLTGHIERAASFLLGEISRCPSVPKKAVRDHLGMASAHFGRDVVRDAGFQAFLSRHRIAADHHRFELLPQPTFEPYPGGGWTSDD